MKVSFCVIAYNEQRYIRGILDNIVKQDYPHADMEIILVDGASVDKTLEYMTRFKEAYSNEFADIKILNNPKRTLPCGWNVALREYSGDVIVKVDAHAIIPEDFVSKNVEAIESGEYIVGGERPCIIDDPKDPFKKMLLMAENSLFGSSIAPFRNRDGQKASEKRYVNSLFHAMYSRKVFDEVGFFNENLSRTEDNEIHYRMREAGFRFALMPDIISYQYMRADLKAMLKQKFNNGYWIGITAKVCPQCLSMYHYVPGAFAAAVLASTGAEYVTGKVIHATRKKKNPFDKSSNKTFRFIRKGVRKLSYTMWGAYIFLDLLMSAFSIIKEEKKEKEYFFLPLVILAMHLSYGFGTIAGIASNPETANK